MTPQGKYEFELWVNDFQVGDISKLAQNRSFTLTRNGAEELYFLMNLSAFEDYCARLGAAPSSILEAYITDIRVKRNGTYLFGVQVNDMQYNLNQGEINVEVRGTGFLDLLKDRYVTKSYNGYERVATTKDLIITTQSGDSSNDFGITFGPNQYETTIIDTERNYSDQNVRDAIINLTDLDDGNFDFRFNYDRSFETFQQIGIVRPDLKFTYPYNVNNMTIPHTAQNLFNYIIRKVTTTIIYKIIYIFIVCSCICIFYFFFTYLASKVTL